MPRTATLSVLGLYNWDSHILDSINLPEGVSLETLRDTILMDCAELEIIYPNPEFFKQAAGLWARSRLESWARMYKALSEDYNPLHNFDRHEEYKDERTGDSNGTNTDRVTAYNSSSFTDRGQSAGSSHSSDTLEHTAHLYGNIGVTRSQEMVQDELDLRKTDIYHIISKEFKERFCIMLY